MNEKLDETLIQSNQLNESMEFKSPLEILLEAEEEYLIQKGWKIDLKSNTNQWATMWLVPVGFIPDLGPIVSQENAVKKQRSSDYNATLASKR